MIRMDVNLKGDGALKGIDLEGEADSIEVILLPHGMSSGRPSVTLHFTIDGKHFIAQTSARLFCAAARAITVRYPDLFEGD